jgi:uncharacterized damage-inducible protein DinB
MEVLIRLLGHGFDRKAWHGPVLKGSLRGVGLKAAAFRPGRDRNSIRDLVYHCAYWKYCARGWLREALGDDRGPKFPRSPANFPARTEKLTEKQWKADLRMLSTEHRLLLEVVERFPEKLLDKHPIPGAPTHGELIAGIAQHDLYHCGQVSMLKRLAAKGSADKRR